MILDKQGKTFTTEGKNFAICGMVWANSESDYCGLFGYVSEIRDGDDKETENEDAEIVCDFMVPTKEHMVTEIESRFSKLYRMPKRIDDLPLDGVVMASEMLEPVTEKLPESSGKLFVLVFTYDGECDSTIGTVAVSADKSMLMRAMFDDLDAFEEKEYRKAILTSTAQYEDREYFFFEPAAVEESSFSLHYCIYEVPVYGAMKGGVAA